MIKKLAYYDKSDCKKSEFYRDEYNKNAFDDNFVLLRRSPRLKNMMVYTLGSGLLCSVKNCRNRLSKDLSLFSYPKDLNLRIKWMEKCGLKTDPAKIVISTVRVCGFHFEDDCFKSIELRNRLKPGSIPSLFLGDGLISVFPNVHTVLKIGLTLPVTSASPERVFSKLKIVKNRLHSTMGQERLQGLMRIKIINTFASKSPHLQKALVL